jgi:excisionase family DNA binding protein
MTIDFDHLLTVPQAAKRTPLTEGQLRGWIDRGYIPVLRFGGRIYIHAEELRKAFKKQFQESISEPDRASSGSTL